MKKYFLGQLLLLSILFFGCTKVSVDVEKVKFTPQELARRYVDKVSQNKEDEKSISRENLKAFAPSEMDWKLFWKLLTIHDGKHLTQSDVESLALSDCSPSVYEAFLVYLGQKNYKVAPILKVQPCPFPKNNSVLAVLIEKLNGEGSEEVQEALFPTLKELLKNFSEADFSIFESKISAEIWLKIFQKLVKKPEELRRWLLVFSETKIARIPFSSHVIDAKFKSLYEPSNYLNDDLWSWTYLLTLSTGVEVPHATVQQTDFFWQNFFTSWKLNWEADIKRNNCLENCLLNSLEILSFTRKLLVRFPELSFRWKLLWNEKMQRNFEELLRVKEESAKAVLFQANSVDSSWFLLRLNKLYALNPDARSQLQTPWASGENFNSLEQVIRYRVLAHASSNPWQRFSFIQKLCDIMTKEGAPETSLSMDALPNTILPGCYKVSVSGDFFKSDKIILPFDSVLRSYGNNWEWQVKEADLAFVDLSSYEKSLQFSKEVPPEEANALVVPLLVGLRVGGQPEGAPDEIVFFPVHTTLRKAKSNLFSRQKPNQGMQGGNFKLISDRDVRSFLPSFLSLGAEGQKGAPPVPGGYGDESYFSTTRIDREINDWTGPQGEGVSFVPKLTYTELRDYWVRAKSTGALPLLQYSVDHILKSLQVGQKQKLLRYCELEGYKDEKIENCFQDRLIPKAENIIREFIDNFQALSTQQKKMVPAELNGEKVFSLPPGTTGGVNPSGAIGERGSFWLELN